MWKELGELDVILVKLDPYQREKLIENLQANKELYKSTAEALQAANEEISRMGFYDQLTNIPNRKYFEEHFDRILAQAQRDNIKFALLYLDLDGLKSINDNFGHKGGDIVLKTIANRIEPILRTNDFIARLGGDEFCLVAYNYKDEIQVETIAKRLTERCSFPIKVGNMGVNIGLSIGIAMYPKNGESFDALLSSADTAMYKAKHDKNSVYAFA